MYIIIYTWMYCTVAMSCEPKNDTIISIPPAAISHIHLQYVSQHAPETIIQKEVQETLGQQ